ncbi:MAG: DoxX family protein [Bryobacteraceae bacterium]|nr:DoxX family protein [Bryobacteraceae bacterium]
MQTATQLARVRGTGKGIWAGRVFSGLATLFLLMDGGGKLMRLPPVVEGTVQLGYPADVVLALGIVLLVCTAAYAMPRTSVFGAILLTGYLGGAVATHVRMANPLFSHTLFPIYLGAMVWGGLLLRDERLRALLPVRKAPDAGSR